ncbi:hypothetical protein CAPTEDRAFT_199217 [Capitella teleta]|uniref:Uncharacterized protein n=1 Tax=Capitella teleta TaxID=283909 RepID=R7V508_CAPTE|nr:hypothetical protein CAPTEDRAFT_199217 [Capitella teleta]|eukprot:ELU13943.1 hypothetical protein CAPTEDRAFT_199217 [Capitella teleta]
MGPAVLQFFLSLRQSRLVKELGALTGEVFVNEDVRVLEVPPALHNAVPGALVDDGVLLFHFSPQGYQLLLDALGNDASDGGSHLRIQESRTQGLRESSVIHVK